ncbi:MAG: DoxX family protein [Bacteroidaceae bacterium]|nr:DoxX family protein [Bacteroidaceae bacterium]
MASASKIKSRSVLLLTNLCRLLLAVVFIVSGFVKAVDPKGLLYKLQEYVSAFSLTDIIDSDWLMPAAVVLSAVEFVLGVLLLMGTCRRFSAIATLFLMLLFTPWTLVLAIWNPVHDCGCFGDAFQLSNWATFFKNVLLLVMAAYLWVKRSRIVRFVSTRGSWMVTLFALVYIGTVEYIGLEHLPVMDFRPFHVGADLNEGIRDIPAEYKMLYRYEKDGEVLELEQEGAPDSTWNYLGTRTDLLSEGVPARIQDFWFAGMDDGDDISETLLNDTNYICLLVLEDVARADESRVDKINDMYDYCTDNGIAFYALTSSLDDDVALWKKHTGAEYPFYSGDNLLLKTMIRSNPGILVLKGGKVVAKWNVVDAPDLYGDDASAEDDGAPLFMHAAANAGKLGKLFHWMFMFFTPLLIIFLVDVLTSPRGKKKQQQTEASAEQNEQE